MGVPGYDVAETLFVDEWCALYRARRLSDGLRVLLKTTHREPALGARRLEREWKLVRDLSVTGVPRACELLRDGERGTLVMEDPGGVPLDALPATARRNLDFFFDLAIRLCTMLTELHRRELVHGSLRPSSLLVDPATAEAWFTELGLCSRFSGGPPASPSRHFSRAALHYASPEQTGRTNRVADYRSDFYSLGVVLYELLTGTRPFGSDDALELIHAHIAKTPPAPAQIEPSVPGPLSRIVMKLLAKTPEERYQSALGLKHDLGVCAHEWKTDGSIADFPLGRRDVSDFFLVPQKLYGRDREVEELVRAFDRTCEGRVAMTLVAGYAGIGKTSLIQELYKPIVRERGYFVAGKFDQVARNVPFGALIQALRALVHQILAESDDRLASWRERLTEALGGNGGMICEVIPELSLIIGEQSPPTLGPLEAQNRFRLAFQNFVGALARKEHPLVIFLDDLQWADAATLRLLGPLLTSPEMRFLFVIGAYRDNEVDTGHPLARALGLLEAEGVEIRRVLLGPIPLTALTLFVHDTLHGDLAEVKPLAELVMRKTDGNPFFVIQFLKTLKQDGLLRFDPEGGYWSFTLEGIAGAMMTDNVIDLMTRKIQRLPAKTQRALSLAACLGTPFDLETLAVISEEPPEAAAADLGEAIEEGLVLPATASAYAFLHDRVQQAAYALIPSERQQHVHLTVGRLLIGRWDRSGGEKEIFDIAGHLNIGSELMGDDTERLALARLNLVAGRKAKSSTAYEASLGYLRAGLGLLGDRCWETEYELMLALSIETAECQYLCGLFEEAERDFDRLLARARTRLDRARVYSLKILQYEHLSRYADAIRTGREGLALFGIVFPDVLEQKQSALDAALAAIDRLMGERTVDSLVGLPVMKDPEIRAVMKLLGTLHTSCFLSGDKALTLLNAATMVRLSLVHGNIEESAYAYCLLAAMLLGPIREEYRSAYEFGLLAQRLNERLYDSALRAKVLMMFAWSISPWRMPLEASFPVTREAFRLGHETGLFVDAAWALFNEIWLALLSSPDLASFHTTYAPNVEYSERIKMGHIADAKRVILGWGRALAGETWHPLTLTDATFDEDAYRQTYAGQRLFEMFYFVAKLAVFYAFEEYGAALDAARTAEAVIKQDFTGTIWDELRVFYHALVLAALHAGATPRERELLEVTLEALAARLKKWAENSPNNFEAQHLVVRAEIARIRGDVAEATALYETAADAARTSKRLREEALADELYAKFWRGRGQTTVARVFMTEARDAYARWGAMAKVKDLERRYSTLLPGEGVAAGGDDAALLDIGTVTKAAHAIAVEMDLEDLLRKLLRIALENAGAQRGIFLVERDGRLLVEAEGRVDPDAVEVLQAVPLESSDRLAKAVVHYVHKTGESVVLGDATADERFSSDPYIASTHPRSILCVPVVHQGKAEGVLYLENNLTRDAFTVDRVKVMHILSSQAAISLENTRLYDEMKQEVARRRKAEEDLRAALAEVETLKNRLQAENVYLQEEIRKEHNFVEMVGSSPALLAVLRDLDRVAPTDSTVLVSGETGTGKELIARAIHNRSTRRDRPLVKVNCSAISAGLVESELFGHVKGAFTGALERRVGRFELANGGTIFLDEVGELPLETQVKLLRVLQEQEFEPVGSSTSVRVDVRVIAATNRDLEEAVRNGRFRADLFYRLNVFPIRTPALRERKTDIPPLVTFFVAHFAKKFGKRVEAVSKETMDRLVGYAWPGNIRELQNIVERGVVLSPGPTLELGPELLPSTGPGVEEGTRGRPIPAVLAAPAPASAGLDAVLEDVERSHILSALKQAGWVIEGARGAAKILKLHPNTLRSRMEKLGIRRRGDEAS